MKKLDIFNSLVTDGMKLVDKSDLFKDFFNDNDEFLSSSSWGNLIKFCATKKIEISDINEAYYFTIFTAYLNTFETAIKYYGVSTNNFAIPKYDIQYNHKELDINNISTNKLVQVFHDIFKEFTPREEQNKVIKYINNNIKLIFYKVIEKNPLVLNKYIKYINSDIFDIEKNDLKKELYNIEIEQEYKDIVLADKEGLTLQDLYIEPNFRVFQKHLTKDDERYENKSYKSKYCDVEDISIHTFITDTLNGENNLNLVLKDVNTIFISGYPGQGKSSFTKRFVFDIINNKIDLSYDVILIKLKNIENPNDFLNKDLQTIVKENTPFEIESLDNYVVVLDGLDELVMKSNISIQDSNTICERISRSKIKTIVTTRHSYVDFDKLYEKNILTIELKELNQDQQISWLDKYTNTHKDTKITKEIIKQFHKNENKHILELINQPILLHMIADMNIDSIENLDKSSLYKKFFDILVNRKWEKDKHELLDGIDEDRAKLALRNMLQELAHNIFTSEYEYIHKIDFEKLESVKEFQELLVSKNNDSLQDNLKGVMVSFYFKEVKKDEEDIRVEEHNENYAIEFLHKSLMEYMVAEYIWEKVQDLLEKNRYKKYIVDEKKALELFWNLFNKKILSIEIVNNLIAIIKNEDQKKRDELSLRLDSFMNYFLDKDFIYQVGFEEVSPIKKSIAIFCGFWNILSHLDSSNHLPQLEIYKNKFLETLGIVKNSHNNIYNFSHSDFKNYIFRDFSLDSVNFNNSDLTDCKFFSSGISEVDFNCLNFNYTEFAECYMIDVSFFNSTFSEGVFSYNNCLHSTFVDTILSKVEIHMSNFYDNIFLKVSFKMCEIFESIFINATFDDIEFNDCNFTNTIFNKVKFINCSKIDFKDLKEQGATFLNCTHDGEEI